MMMKRLGIALLTLALALTPCAAWAAGNANIARSEDVRQNYGDYVRAGCALDGALYLCGTHSIFRWMPGEADVAPLALELPPCEEGEDRWIERTFSDGEGLYLLCVVYDNSDGGYDLDRLEAIPLSVDGDAATPGEPVEVDPGELAVDYGDGSLSLAQINGACFAGGKLFLRAQDEVLRGVWALDIEAGEGEFIEFDGMVSGMAPCGDRLLLLCDDYEAQASSLWLYDPEREEAVEACDPAPWPEERGWMDHNGLAYSAESGRLFYQSDGYVMAAEGFDLSAAQPVAELSTYYSGDALLLPGDLYVYLGSDVVCVRATGPDALPEARLIVRGGAYNNSLMNAYNAFGNAHPDVAMALDPGFVDAEAVIPAMLSGDDSTDIYVVDVDSELFDALRDRGYMLELTNPAITEAVGAMYPAIREVLTSEGGVVAVPCAVRGWTMGFNRDAMEALGLEEEDLPTSWPELLAWIPELAEALDENSGVDILDVNQRQLDARSELLGQLLSAWRLRMGAQGETNYDDPALAALMQSVLDLDLEALDLPEEPDYDNYVLYGTGEDGARGLLLSFSEGCTLGNLYPGYVPALLSLSEGEEGRLPLYLSVAFVNPHSKHPELAQAFLAEMLDNLEPDVAYNLSDKLNDPLPDPYYATFIEDAQVRLDALKAQLEVTAAEDAPAIEANIASEEARLADLEAERWAISPEAIAWYRAHAANLAVVRYDLLSGADNQTMDELNALSEQLLEGTLAPADFLNVFNQKAQMRAKEGY